MPPVSSPWSIGWSIAPRSSPSTATVTASKKLKKQPRPKRRCAPLENRNEHGSIHETERYAADLSAPGTLRSRCRHAHRLPIRTDRSAGASLHRRTHASELSTTRQLDRGQSRRRSAVLTTPWSPEKRGVALKPRRTAKILRIYAAANRKRRAIRLSR